MNEVALIDADSLLYICLYNKKDLPPKSLEECKEAIDNMIFNILDVTEATHYILALTIGKNFRYSIKEDYKGDRKSEKPVYFKECKDYLLEKYQAVFNENLEADDIINIYSKNIESSFICACDSDILEGLEGSHFNYKKFQWVITNEEQANYKFWTNMITGTHNGISGIKGKGIKYVEKLFSKMSQYGENYRDIVFNEYINHYGEYIGVNEFASVYRCIKILDKFDKLEIKEPIKFDRSLYIKNNVKEERTEEW